MSAIATPFSTLDLQAAARQARPRSSAELQADFSAVLGRSVDQGKSPQQQARDTAEQFVSIGLVQPLLAQLRSTNQAAPPFAPSQAEKQFQSLLDANIAQQITRAKRFPLVDSIAAILSKHIQDRPTVGNPVAESQDLRAARD